MQRLVFATGNKEKLREAEAILGFKLDGTNLIIDEIQSLDGVEVATKKARAYYDKLNEPLFAEDSVAEIEAIKPLPGPYIKDFWSVLGNEGLCRFVDGKSRRIVNKVILVFIDENNEEHVFVGETVGEIAEHPVGEDGWGWDPIFIPEGTRETYAQMGLDQKNKYSSRSKALIEFRKWIQNHD
jgi:non-canonical purine NTP pyrophosphatase (RdgB/HAM1 family)